MDAHLKAAAFETLAKIETEISFFENARVLLTGGAGFLGAHFTHCLLAMNDSGALKNRLTLSLVDNFSRGNPNWLQSIQSRADLQVIQQNIIDPISWDGWDIVIHAASIASPSYYRQMPIETMDANVQGLRHLLDAAVSNQSVRSFLFFSSSEIYGDPDPAHIPTSEEYRGYVSCTGPRACYDESKRYGETLCVNFHRVHRVPVKIVRPFNNYGPGLNIQDRRVLPDFFRDILQKKDIVLLSDGLSTRTFCYVTDAMSGYLKALASDYHGEAFNIGTEFPEVSMGQLAELVIRVTGNQVGLVSQRSEDIDYLTDNPLRRCPSIEKARRLLKYNPTVSLEKGLFKTYQYYRDNPV